MLHCHKLDNEPENRKIYKSFNIILAQNESEEVFHFISQFYGRAHNAKAFLKCAPLDSVRSLVRMIWFDHARKDLNPRLRNGVRELATEPGCLPGISSEISKNYYK